MNTFGLIAVCVTVSGALCGGAHRDASFPCGAGDGEGMAEAGLSCGLGDVDEHAVVDRLGAAVRADDLRVRRVVVLLSIVHDGLASV